MTTPAAALIDKSLPHSAEAERMVLGCSLLDNDVFEEAIHRLLPEDFYIPSHSLTFRAMVGLRQSGMEIEPVALSEELQRTGDLERVGGLAYIAGLFDGSPRFSTIKQYVDIVLERSKARQLVRLGDKLVSTAMDNSISLNEQLAFAERGLLDISTDRGASAWSYLSAVTHEYLAAAEKRGESGRTVIDFSTGFHDLDFYTLGLERQTMTVVAARPGVGKTAFGLSLTRKMSEARLNLNDDEQPPVIAWFSMEMPKSQLAQRLVASVAGVNARSLHLGRLDRDEWRRVVEAEQRIAGWRVHLDDRCGLSIRAMREALRQLRQAEKTVDVVFVDYLQLGDGDRQKGDSRAVEVGRFSQGLTAIAKDFNCAVVAVSQLNRGAEGRSDKRPNMGELRDSGQIEQDAYMIWALYRDEIYNAETTDKGVAEVLILKNRNGETGTVRVSFDGARMRFEDLANGY